MFGYRGKVLDVAEKGQKWLTYTTVGFPSGEVMCKGTVSRASDSYAKRRVL